MPTCPQCGSETDSADVFCSSCGSHLVDRPTGDTADKYREPLLIERIADRIGVTALVRHVPNRELYPPYVLVALSILIAFGILPVYSYLTVGSSSVIADPFTAVAIVLGLILAVGGVRYMADGYARAVSDLGLQDRPDPPNVDRFRGIVPFRVKLGVYALGLVVYYLNLFFGRGIQPLLEIDGVVTTVIGQFVLAPLVNIALVAEFAVMFVGIHVLLPRRIEQEDLELFFHDPRNMGGFKTVGQLLKRTYYLFTIGVFIYFIVGYGRVVLSSIADTPLPMPGLQAAVFFTVAWLLGLVSIAYSMFQMHRIMLAKKEQRLRELEADIKTLIENPFDIRSSRVTDREVMETKERQLEEVRATRTYPTTFAMWSQIFASALLPQFLYWTIQFTV